MRYHEKTIETKRTTDEIEKHNQNRNLKCKDRETNRNPSIATMRIGFVYSDPIPRERKISRLLFDENSRFFSSRASKLETKLAHWWRSKRLDENSEDSISTE
jgi:hypothetical protein